MSSTPDQDPSEVLTEIMATRRSVRSFSEAMPARRDVERIIAAGLAAPYAAAMSAGGALDRRFFVLSSAGAALGAAARAIQAHAQQALAVPATPAPLRARLEPVAEGRITGRRDDVLQRVHRFEHRAQLCSLSRIETGIMLVPAVHAARLQMILIQNFELVVEAVQVRLVFRNLPPDCCGLQALRVVHAVGLERAFFASNFALIERQERHHGFVVGKSNHHDGR